jgi:16S rRNA (cytidine1402-2'-O)-methyltransferase
MPLVLVPTPLGNLRDVTLRALDVLRESELILAEDTRTARRLLAAHNIPVKELWSYREQNAASVTPAILRRAAAGLVALVSDAGMPAIADPGRELVAAAQAAGVAVEALPGPSAFVCAAVLSGFPLEGFSFEGFVPRQAAAREKAFRDAFARGRTSVWYEAPHRIGATLAALAEWAPGAPLFVARELTKLHEQQAWGTATEVAAQLETPVRGELVLVAGPYRPATETPSADVDARIDAGLATGASVAALARELAPQMGIGRRELYARIVRRRQAGRTKD